MKKYLILLAKLIVFALATAFFVVVLMVPFAFSGLVDVNNPEHWAVLVIEGIQLVAVLLPAWLIIHYWDELPFVDDMGFRIKGRGKDMFYGFCVAAAIYAIDTIEAEIAVLQGQMPGLLGTTSVGNTVDDVIDVADDLSEFSDVVGEGSRSFMDSLSDWFNSLRARITAQTNRYQALVNDYTAPALQSVSNESALADIALLGTDMAL